jgi:ribosomal protein L31E
VSRSRVPVLVRNVLSKQYGVEDPKIVILSQSINESCFESGKK